jgi:hypothetical protein
MVLGVVLSLHGFLRLGHPIFVGLTLARRIWRGWDVRL